SRASSWLRVTISTLASVSIGRARSRSSPLTFTASAALARPGPIDSATSCPVTGPSNFLTEPSGKVIATIGLFFPDPGSTSGSGDQRSLGQACQAKEEPLARSFPSSGQEGSPFILLPLS